MHVAWLCMHFDAAVLLLPVPTYNIGLSTKVPAPTLKVRACCVLHLMDTMAQPAAPHKEAEEFARAHFLHALRIQTHEPSTRASRAPALASIRPSPSRSEVNEHHDGGIEHHDAYTKGSTQAQRARQDRKCVTALTPLVRPTA